MSFKKFELRPESHFVIAQAVKACLTDKLNEPISKSCLTCVHFDEQNEICKKWNARPPARIIAYSCPDYLDNQDIPF